MLYKKGEDMKRCLVFWLGIILLLSMAACEDTPTTWQEQYDLGVRYLSEGSYEEAIIAFTVAIEIDSKHPEAYISRGDAYSGLEGTTDTLTAALADYESALELDETLVDAWLGLADVYIRLENYDKAAEVLREGYTKTENSVLLSKLTEIEAYMVPELSGEAKEVFDQCLMHMSTGDYSGIDAYLWSLETPDAWLITNGDTYADLCYDGEQLSTSLTGIGLKMINSRGYWYYGELKNGVPNGEGTCFDACGGYYGEEKELMHCNIFEGLWADGKPNGSGVETYYIADASGNQCCQITTGTWVNGLQDGTMRLEIYRSGELEQIEEYTCEQGKPINSSFYQNTDQLLGFLYI